MEKIIRYGITESNNLQKLVDNINKDIEDGWQPFGNLIYSEKMYQQTLVKFEETN